MSPEIPAHLYDPEGLVDGNKPPEPSVDEELREAVAKQLCILADFYSETGEPSYHLADNALDAIMHLLTNRIEAEAKAFGGCRNCYGKGYASYSTAHIGRHYFKKVDDPVFCKCARGKQLKALVGKAVEAARVDEVRRFAQKYRPINKPIKESPMELTDEAIVYNKVANDIVLYEEQRIAQLTGGHNE